MSSKLEESHDKQSDDKRHCGHTVLFLPNQTNCGCHHSQAQAFPALHSSNKNNPNYFFRYSSLYTEYRASERRLVKQTVYGGMK